jgi:outer membrane protein assembly factor BamE (lipoprotein component of BamABCDE complex)
MKKLIMFIGLLFAAALLTGCASSATSMQHNVKLYKTSEIKVGKSNKENVSSLLGSPDTVTSDAAGNEIWSYAARELSSGEKAAAVGTRIVFFPLLPVEALVGPPSLHPDKKCDIYFDNEGIVKSLSCTGKI